MFELLVGQLSVISDRYTCDPVIQTMSPKPSWEKVEHNVRQYIRSQNNTSHYGIITHLKSVRTKEVHCRAKAMCNTLIWQNFLGLQSSHHDLIKDSQKRQTIRILLSSRLVSNHYTLKIGVRSPQWDIPSKSNDVLERRGAWWQLPQPWQYPASTVA